MRISINGTNDLSSIDRVVEGAERARDDGFAGYWLAQIFGMDALTALAVIGREVDRVELGTAVVPTYPRHPQMLAAQALTTQAAAGGRLTLGIGLSHRFVVEQLWGYSYDKPLRHMREYLDVLLPLLAGEAVDVHGETVTAVGSVALVGVDAPAVVIAALGTQMLKLAGSRGCGTITWCTGVRTLGDHIVPTITAAAEAAGRPAPRIVASLPIAVTAHEADTRASVATGLSGYGDLPSYRAMLDLEGVEGPADVAIVGDEDHVRAALDGLAAAGVTEFAAAVSGLTAEDRARTRGVLASVATGS